MEKAREKWSKSEVKAEEKRGEGCSCLYGNPCVDK
jgi:hypothetical protein